MKALTTLVFTGALSLTGMTGLALANGPTLQLDEPLNNTEREVERQERQEQQEHKEYKKNNKLKDKNQDHDRSEMKEQKMEEVEKENKDTQVESTD